MILNISSISGIGISWEEYLEQLKKAQEKKAQENAQTTANSFISESESAIAAELAPSAAATGNEPIISGGPSGLSGHAGIASKSIEALLYEDDESLTENTSSSVKNILANQARAYYANGQITRSFSSVNLAA
ncbi:MAG: hypothetical protein LBT23_00215 [Synergistaceae bacterium]|nr:hypothetical protein [Synergistaceae bacterium]